MRQALAAVSASQPAKRFTMDPRRMRGSRLDRSRIRALVLRGDPQVLKLRQSIYTPDLFLGVLIDCSNKMDDAIERAKLFASAIAVAAKGIPGIEARFFGYSHNTIYDAGDADSPPSMRLATRCCKNVTAALNYVADRALDSKRKNRLLFVVDSRRRGTTRACGAWLAQASGRGNGTSTVRKWPLLRPPADAIRRSSPAGRPNGPSARRTSARSACGSAR